jgi:hypothetical protein
MQKQVLGTVTGHRVFGQIARPFLLKPQGKPPRPFGIFEDGNLLDNFGIQSSGHFYFEI